MPKLGALIERVCSHEFQVHSPRSFRRRAVVCPVALMHLRSRRPVKRHPAQLPGLFRSSVPFWRQHGSAARQAQHHLGLVRPWRHRPRADRRKHSNRNRRPRSPLGGQDSAAGARRPLHFNDTAIKPSNCTTSSSATSGYAVASRDCVWRSTRDWTAGSARPIADQRDADHRGKAAPARS